jgi:predicted acetyltransferase
MALVEYVVPSELSQKQRYAAILVQALSFMPDRALQWMDDWMGVENLRVVVRDGQLVGGFGVIDMGHWFAGRPVKTLGINAVAIAPEARGAGLATDMMKHALMLAHERGYALSSLFPATYTVYRRVGYELGGSWQRVRVPITGLIKADRALSVRELRPDNVDDMNKAKQIYRARCAMSAGMLERGDYLWKRIVAPIGRTAYCYLIESSEGPEAYVTWTQKDAGGLLGYELEVRELCALSARGARRALTLLCDADSLARVATVPSAPVDMVLGHALEVPAETATRMHWLLRLVDVKAALEQRAYDPLVRGEVELEITDEVLAHNHQKRWILTVENGVAQVREGGGAKVRAHVRGLASVYTGALTPREVQVLGLMDGDAAQLRVLGSLFAGPAPWVAEMY